MNRKFVVILKGPGNKDLFFDEHSISIWGRVPRDIYMLWLKKEVDHLPTSLVIQAPHVVNNDFSILFKIQDKTDRVLFESQPINLHLHSMNDIFKLVALAESKSNLR